MGTKNYSKNEVKKDYNLFYLALVTLMMILLPSFLFAQGNTNGNSGNSGNAQNCVVSSIYGPGQVNSGQNVLFYVTSNGQHIWTFPSGVNVVGYGVNGNDSVTVNFDQSFSTGTISVRRNGPSCVGVVSSKVVSKVSCEISVDLGSDRKTYYGYSPRECALIIPVITKGTAPYTYNWSDGSSNSTLNACPSQTTDISLTVTDANGCTASDDVHICVTDVRCWAGNSNVQKVEVCHKNNKTLCVSSRAVATLLRIGGSLGDCSEKDNCNYVDGTARMASNFNTIDDVKGNVIIDSYVNNSNKSLVVDVVSIDEQINYQIIDLTGKTVKQGHIYDGENKIDLNDLRKGVYIMKSESVIDGVSKFLIE